MNLPFISVMNSVLRGLIPYKGGGGVGRWQNFLSRHAWETRNPGNLSKLARMWTVTFL